MYSSIASGVTALGALPCTARSEVANGTSPKALQHGRNPACCGASAPGIVHKDERPAPLAPACFSNLKNKQRISRKLATAELTCSSGLAIQAVGGKQALAGRLLRRKTRPGAAIRTICIKASHMAYSFDDIVYGNPDGVHRGEISFNDPGKQALGPSDFSCREPPQYR